MYIYCTLLFQLNISIILFNLPVCGGSDVGVLDSCGRSLQILFKSKFECLTNRRNHVLRQPTAALQHEARSPIAVVPGYICDKVEGVLQRKPKLKED